MASRPRVLIVEDDSDLRRLYALGLNKHGFEVKLAANGAEALDRIESERPDVLLLDLVMPVMDGWEVLEKVNPVGRDPVVPVVVITGRGEPEDQNHHHSVRVWLSKPISIEKLAQAIEQTLPRETDEESSRPANP